MFNVLIRNNEKSDQNFHHITLIIIIIFFKEIEYRPNKLQAKVPRYHLDR